MLEPISLYWQLIRNRIRYTVRMTDLELLVRDKYEGDAAKVTEEDQTRLAAGEPLAYVIGWVPFLGMRIGLSSRPLIPRPETEWWTEQLIAHFKEKFGDAPFTLLDLCAGSGAIGLAVLKAFPQARVSFAELMPAHCAQIAENLERNGLDAARADIRTSDLFSSWPAKNGPQQDGCWDVIASNPPYIPESRAVSLERSVMAYEPCEALFAGEDGLALIRRIAQDTPTRLSPTGELWLEADIENIEAAQELLASAGARKTAILTDPYDRPRTIVAYYP